MEILAGILLLGSGYFLNKNDKTLRTITNKKEPEYNKFNNIKEQFVNNTNTDNAKVSNSFRIHLYKNQDITNPKYNNTAIFDNISPEGMDRIKTYVNLDYKTVPSNLNDVGFTS